MCSYDRLLEIARKAIKSGVDILQLRDKSGSARDILKFSQTVLKLSKGKSLYIINDRVEIGRAHV